MHHCRDPIIWLASGFGLGFIPLAPGTFGSALGLGWAWLVLQCPEVWQQALATMAVCLLGVPICGLAAARLGGVKDPSSVVFDEIAAMPIVFLGVSPELLTRWWVWLLGFGLFRLFDVVKPPPIRWLERLPGGWGIMADDCAAAALAWAVLHGILAVM